MKKRTKIVRAIVILFACLSIVPVRASACGGFVAVAGEKFFHSVYCESIYGLELNSLRWFDTSTKAEAYGLTMCEECSTYYDWPYSNEYCETFFVTNDPLLATAMELSFEDGSYGGFEAGKEFMSEEINVEYENGYENGYEDGYYDGRTEAEDEAERKEGLAEEERRQSRYELFGVIGFLASISLIINWLDNRKKKQ